VNSAFGGFLNEIEKVDSNEDLELEGQQGYDNVPENMKFNVNGTQ